MELNELKSAWDAVKTPVKSNKELSAMLVEGKHPVLKEIRKQFTIEVTVWSAFLLCYYTMFDGDQKPVFINSLLVISMLFALIHNLSGYSFAKYLVNDGTLKSSLERYLAKVKVYAGVSIFSRVVLITGFLIFFTYNIKFVTSKYILLAVVIVVFLVQLRWLFRLWAKRLKILGNAIKDLNGENDNR